MLVVISILAIVAVVALPSITSLSKSGARHSGVSLTMSALDQARAYAISQSANCFFVFANGDPGLPPSHRYRAFAVFQETYVPPPPDQPSAPPYHLLMVRPWTLLPEGVSFRPDTSGEQTVFSAHTQKFLGPKVPGNTSNLEMELPYIEFNSTGGLVLDPTSPITVLQARVRLFEGFIDVSGNPVDTTRRSSKSGTSEKIPDEVLSVSLFTGRAKRDESSTNTSTSTNAPG